MCGPFVFFVYLNATSFISICLISNGEYSTSTQVYKVKDHVVIETGRWYAFIGRTSWWWRSLKGFRASNRFGDSRPLLTVCRQQATLLTDFEFFPGKRCVSVNVFYQQLWRPEIFEDPIKMPSYDSRFDGLSTASPIRWNPCGTVCLPTYLGRPPFLKHSIGRFKKCWQPHFSAATWTIPPRNLLLQQTKW